MEMQNRQWAEPRGRRAGQGSDPEGRPAPGPVRKLVLPNLLSCSHSAALAAGTQPCTECDRDQQAPLSAQGAGQPSVRGFPRSPRSCPERAGIAGEGTGRIRGDSDGLGPSSHPGPWLALALTPWQGNPVRRQDKVLLWTPGNGDRGPPAWAQRRPQSLEVRGGGMGGSEDRLLPLGARRLPSVSVRPSLAPGPR